MKLKIINGPNLNLLGNRETNIYGDISFENYLKQLQEKFKKAEIFYFQSNSEGEIITEIQDSEKDETNGIILNAAAYSHYSIAIRDAIKSISIPVVEVHISNIFSREKFRHKSVISAVCKGIISGFGLISYDLAIQSFIK
ncbi:MAG: type II 3-dehydroquinate dehydratase [Bacteroidales bacterium]|nr:type II 3-dehydroquinate dehydratase [Bacteroidales bacterium]